MDQLADTVTSGAPPLGMLHRWARERRKRSERCELCATDLRAEHQHLIEPATRRLVCACDACALLFSGQQTARYRRVPRGVQLLSDFAMTDAQWEDLLIPINLAFFFRSSTAGRVVAAYPSPAGATESLLTLEAWQQLEEQNPILKELEPDVEALLVNRVGQAREYFRVPIDECYKLVGIIRVNWRGLSGGSEVWTAIEAFRADLKARGAGSEHIPARSASEGSGGIAAETSIPARSASEGS
jgi:Family of unknown function (DUF5947)